MKQPRASHIAVALVAAVLLATGMGLNQWKRNRRIRAQQKTVTKVERELHDLRDLGLTDDDVALRSLKGLLEWEQEELQRLQTSWFDRGPHRNGMARLDAHLHELVALHRNMLESYRRDLRDYRRLGIGDETAIVTFARKKIDRLRRKIATFEQNRSATGVDPQPIHTRLGKLRTTNEQAITHCKNALHRCQPDADAPRAALLRAQLNDKVRRACDLERMLASR